MKEKKYNLPNRLVKGNTKSSQDAKVPIARGGSGSINTNLSDIRWTPARLSVASTVILAPISFAIVLSFKAGNSLVALILIGALVMMGLMYLAVRYIERSEF